MGRILFVLIGVVTVSNFASSQLGFGDDKKMGGTKEGPGARLGLIASSLGKRCANKQFSIAFAVTI